MAECIDAFQGLPHKPLTCLASRHRRASLPRHARPPRGRLARMAACWGTAAQGRSESAKRVVAVRGLAGSLQVGESALGDRSVAKGGATIKDVLRLRCELKLDSHLDTALLCGPQASQTSSKAQPYFGRGHEHLHHHKQSLTLCDGARRQLVDVDRSHTRPAATSSGLRKPKHPPRRHGEPRKHITAYLPAWRPPLR